MAISMQILHSYKSQCLFTMEETLRQPQTEATLTQGRAPIKCLQLSLTLHQNTSY